ncbi:dual adapter for phosphotyrosine and 3-phosphotyrosine and 3-phosphoinositide-like [Ptychodera flava]|uniref:dual adapter for phosphotyrosine and 3-phosphotyrosine and 3-phosphoinositide-like n=1 Tax=Ptychodera flava TaxID=63121 RepID=UPI00396A7561
MSVGGAASFEQLSWFHGNMSRHLAECLLLQNGKDGSYLLRESQSNAGEYTVSVRSKDSVKHFRLQRGIGGMAYTFGMLSFDTFPELLAHFDKQPLVGGETGTLTTLKYPYARDVEEPPCYETFKVHAAFGTPQRNSFDEDQHFANASKEGYLTKEGGIVKNWKTRWFVLCKHELKYYKTRDTLTPIKTLDLRECQGVDWDNYRMKDRDNCFILEFPERTYYVCANTNPEAEEWIKILRWQIRHLQGKGDTIRLN